MESLHVNATGLATSVTGMSLDDDFDLLYYCWRLTTCDNCLASTYPCSWCSISSTCVPNTVLQFPFAILGPIKTESICPLSWRERWELRAKPFSCRCSTMTLMSVVVAVLGTLAGVLLIQLLVWFVQWFAVKWKKKKPGWWKFYEWRPRIPRWQWKVKQADSVEVDDAERQPLLPERG
jgi:hypothetical protein